MTEMQTRDLSSKIEENPQKQFESYVNKSREIQKIETITHVEDLKHVDNLHDYMKKDSVKMKIEQTVKSVQIFKDLEFEHHHKLHINNYCKLRKHILKLEFHNFDYDWFKDINKLDPTNILDLNELKLIPGKLEYTLKHTNINKKPQNLDKEHVDLEVD